MNPDTLLAEAERLAAAGDRDAAIAAFQGALAAGCDNPAAPYNLGVLLARRGDYVAAAEAFRTAIRLHPDFVEAHFNRGCMALKLADPATAVAALRRALDLNPQHHDAKVNLSLALFGCNDIDAAIRTAHMALEERPDDPDVFANLANFLRAIGARDDARLCAEAAVGLDPAHAAARVSLAALQVDAGDLAGARQSCEAAIGIRPDYAEAHWNLALALLAAGDFERGWSEYEWRRRLPGCDRLFPDFGVPEWQGEAVAGKTILVYAEQGNGDTLQFIRLAEPLAERGARVVARVQPGLVHLLRGCPFLAEVAAFGDAVPAADFCLPLLSLPHRLGLRLEAIPARLPYLHPQPADIAAWTERLAEWPAPRVGLVWAGDPRPNDPESNRIDRRRSLTFSALKPILDLPGLSFVSLQKGSAASQLVPQENLLDPTAELHDFADTAALVTHLDAIVTVDTAVAHLAGGLNVPTLLLSRFDACWRWLGNRPTTPWYPRMRVFGQAAPGDWDAAIRSVAQALRETA